MNSDAESSEIQCCGRKCITPFCPHCGQRLEQSALRQLQIYVRAQAKGRRKYFDRIRRTDTETWAVKENAGNMAVRWENWAEVLGEVIAEIKDK